MRRDLQTGNPSSSRVTITVRLIQSFALQVLLPVVCLSASFEAAHALEADESEVKAAVLYNIVKFIGWSSTPQEQQRPIEFGFLGEPAIAENIRQISAGRTIGGRPIHVKIFQRVDDVTQVHVLYIASAYSSEVQRILRPFATSRMLTVSDDAYFLRNGGVLRMFVKANKVRFEINRSAAKKAHLELAESLIALADAVVDE